MEKVNLPTKTKIAIWMITLTGLILGPLLLIYGILFLLRDEWGPIIFFCFC